MASTPLEFPTQVDFTKFVSHYAHDLRSPYNRILGFSRLIIKGQDGPLSDLMKEDMNTVYQNSLQAFRMVNGLIEVARTIGGEKHISLADTPIPALVEQAIAQWKKSYPDKEAQIESQIGATTPVVRADEAQLRQALVGLMAYIAECVKLPATILLIVEEEADWMLFTVTSSGAPVPHPSRLEMDIYGFVSRVLIELHGGQFRKQEIGEGGAVICFALPKG